MPQEKISFLLWLTIIFASIVTSRSQITSNNSRRFPDGFRFGVATAAYQIEGAWDTADKSESIWDYKCHNDPSSIEDGTNGDVACDSYHNYLRDVQMIKNLGVDFYRFSISWPRILPSGFANHVSEDGLNYYSNLIDELLKNNIEPVVTIYHWDLPQRLQDLGGWSNPLIADWFEDYARVLYELFGDRVKKWITINEPKQVCLFGYGLTYLAPSVGLSGIADYMCTKNVLMAHARAWHVYDKEFRPKQNGICGIVVDAGWATGASQDPEDIEAGFDANAFGFEIYTHPIFSESGGFPDRVVRRVAAKSAEQGYPRSRLPTLSEKEINFIKKTSDFYGFNHYSTSFYYKNESITTYNVPSYYNDMNAESTDIVEGYTFVTGVQPYLKVLPWGIRTALNYVRTEYNNPQVIIFENGFSTLGGLEDDDRVSYLRLYLDSILDAIEIDGCNVVGYTAWSLMDNFEWVLGLSVKYGLYEVDYESSARTRTPRKSVYFYRELATTRTLDTTFEPTLIPGVEY